MFLICGSDSSQADQHRGHIQIGPVCIPVMLTQVVETYYRLRFSSDADIVRLTNARIIIIIIGSCEPLISRWFHSDRFLKFYNVYSEKKECLAWEGCGKKIFSPRIGHNVTAGIFIILKCSLTTYVHQFSAFL